MTPSGPNSQLFPLIIFSMVMSRHWLEALSAIIYQNFTSNLSVNYRKGLHLRRRLPNWLDLCPKEMILDPLTFMLVSSRTGPTYSILNFHSESYQFYSFSWFFSCVSGRACSSIYDLRSQVAWLVGHFRFASAFSVTEGGIQRRPLRNETERRGLSV